MARKKSIESTQPETHKGRTAKDGAMVVMDAHDAIDGMPSTDAMAAIAAMMNRNAKSTADVDAFVGRLNDDCKAWLSDILG